MTAVITTWRDFVGPHPLQTLIPDNYGRIGRGDLRGYEILFHEPDRTLFVRTYKGLCEIPCTPESDLPYIFWGIGKLLEHLLEYEKWLEKRGAEEIAEIKEVTAERLAELEHQNEAFKLLFSQQSEVETGSQEDLRLKIEALKAARAADRAGFDAVIRELREEVARLKGGAK